MAFKTVAKIIAVGFLIGLPIYYLYPNPKIPTKTKIDELVVLKSERKLLAYSDGQLIKTYKVALGRNPIGHKQYEGDNKTPEGSYKINDKNPLSAYHKNLGISYPNSADIARAKKLNRQPGGAIKIHGLRNGTGIISKLHRWADWTRGCIAVTDSEIDELYESVAVGTPIIIKP